MSQIPEKKHSKEELADLRARTAMQMAGQQVVNPYNEKIAKKPIIIMGYLCALAAPLYLMILKFQDKFSYELSDFKIMLGCILLAVLIAAFVFFKRSLSRHHASFMVIIALISSFSLVYLVNKDDMLKREVLIMLGQDPPAVESEAKRIVEDAINNISSPKPASAIKEELKPEEEKVVLTAEEKAEMEKMFGPVEERRARELEAARLKAREDAKKINNKQR